MLEFMLNKKVLVKRCVSTLDEEYNRPTKVFESIGTYLCCTAENTTTTAQMLVQKQNTTDLGLYTEPEANIRVGDMLYIYEIDEYDEIILSSEYKAIADKPYKKRTFLEVPLKGIVEV